ncbi:hypothetical protein [Nocardioides perillae]|uniref:Uncharacterized protein n=1 Tax=Nocardioides perillae TaxID=1119534 RepID=A0A7Y9RS70_9ACTN|nr:hypothetical protein [Nocardioides perillae]NYG55641.1 hypothetical protein [Nocardioides perillae]
MRNPVLVPAVVATALLVALAVAAVVVTSRPVEGGAAPLAVRAAGTPAAPAAAPAPRGAGRARPLSPGDLLRAWDARRGRAWAAGDLPALRALYTAGSATAAADLRMLRAWRARGLRVTGLRPEVLEVSVLHRGPGRLVLRVTDRWPRAVAAGRGTRRLLPAAPVATRRVELHRSTAGGSDASRWQVVEVRPAG